MATLLARYAYMTAGFFVLAAGLTLIMAGRVGADSWSVLQGALTLHLPLTFGQISQLVGVVVLGIAWILGVRPTLGTFLNMYLVGFFYDLITLHWRIVPAPVDGVAPEAFLLPAPSGLWDGLAYLVVGNLVLGLGAGWYISAGLGQGPRDNLMVALVRKTGGRVSVVKSSIEYTVLFIGWLLGGPVGWGTLISAFLVGQAMEWSLEFFRRLEGIGRLGYLIHVPIPSRRHVRKTAEAGAAGVLD